MKELNNWTELNRATLQYKYRFIRYTTHIILSDAKQANPILSSLKLASALQIH